MARLISSRSATTGRFASTGAAKRSSGEVGRHGLSSGALEKVTLKSRGGKTVSVSPAAARVLRATEELRETVSKDW